MAAYTGLLAIAKDKGTSVPEKLKLVKFAWSKPEVVIPNKYQELLDFVCGLIVNRKKNGLEEEDEILVWQSLVDFLKASQSSIHIKPSVSKALTETIRKHISGKSNGPIQDTKHLTNILDCGSLLLSMPASQSSFTFSDRCQQLSVLLQFCRNDCVIVEKAQELVKCVISELTRLQSLQRDQKLVISSILELLSVFVEYQTKFADSNLQHFILESLFHRNHREAHVSFIELHAGDSKKRLHLKLKDSSKYLTKVYSALFNELNDYLMSTFLPAFISEFLKQNKDDSNACFFILKYATQLLRIHKDTDNLEMKLACLEKLFKTCVEIGCDIFANERQQDFTNWLQTVLEFFLPHFHERSWFGFMSSVLTLRPLVIDRYLTKVLTAALKKVDKENESIEQARDSFLSQLIDTFLKLRRIPYLHQCLLQVILSGVPIPIMSSSLNKLKKKLQVMFNQVPISSLMDMWSDINKKLELTLSTAENTNAEISTVTKLSWLLFLLNCLLSHTQFFDQHSMGMAEEKLHSLLEQTEHSVLKPLAKGYKTSKKEIPILEDVLITWAYVKMLLYPKWREHAAVALHGGEGDKGTKTLMKKVSVSTKVKVILQRRQVLTGNVNKEDNYGNSTDEVNELVAKLLEDLAVSKATRAEYDQHALPLFQEFAQIFPLVGHWLEDELIKKSNPVAETGGGASSLYLELDRFLHHPATMEHRQLQTHLVTAIWSKLLTTKSDRSPKKKKKKLSSSKEGLGDEPISKMFQFITDAEITSADFSINPDEIASILTLAEPINPDLVELLSCLSQEFIPLLNLKCQLGYLSLAACLPSASRTMQTDEVSRLVEQKWIQSLSGKDLTQFFSVLSPDKFLEFSLKLCSEPSKMSRRFMECSTAVVMNRQNQSAIISIVPVAKRIADEMQSEAEEGKSKESTIFVASTLIHNYGQDKVFNVKGVKSAAREIFCVLSKTVLKNVPDWIPCQDDKYTGLELEGGDSVNKDIDDEDDGGGGDSTKKKKSSKPLQKAGKKRKILDDASEVEMTKKEKEKKRRRLVMVEDSMLFTVVKCMSEILMGWTSDLGDDEMNEQLTKAVSIVHERLLEKGTVKQASLEIKLLRLKFIKAIFECQKRLMSSNRPPSFSESDPSMTEERQQSPSNLFSLFSNKGILDIWTNVFTLATSELSKLVSSSFSEDESNYLLITRDTATHSTSTPTTAAAPGSKIERHEDSNIVTPQNFQQDANSTKTRCSPDSLSGNNDSGETTTTSGFVIEETKSWPKHLTLCTDILLDVLEIGALGKARKQGTGGPLDNLFTSCVGSLMKHLSCESKSDPISVIISLNLWQQLATSSLIVNHVATEMTDYVYQVISHSSSLLQHLNHQRIKSTSSASFLQASLDLTLLQKAETNRDNKSLKSSVGSNGEKDVRAGVCRFILHTLVKFLKFAKDTINLDLTSLCLQVAPGLTLTCPADIRALQLFVNAFVFFHPRSTVTAISAVLALVSKLVCACVQLGCQSRLNTKGAEVLEDLVDCAKLVSRVLTVLTEGVLGEEVNKFGHCVLSDYIMELQKGALHPKVKRELQTGLYQLLSVCGHSYLSALNAALPSDMKETFKFMHQDYDRFYKFKYTV